MRLPAQEIKPNEERKRRRRTGTVINGNVTNGGSKNEDMNEISAIRQQKVANFSHHKRVADYLLGRSVGEGSFAKVRLGLHVQTAEEVAIKVISKARARKDAYVHKNLRREGRILQMARHKNIIQVYDILETDNNYYLVTEFCKGGELIDIVTEKGCLSENDVRKYVFQLVSAVVHLHNHGIVHRDLKVENLLLDDRGDLKIIDFGLSNVIPGTTLDPTRALATQCGSPAYAAPELLAKNMYGPKVDVWSIGVITYALLVGKLPFTVEPFRIPKLCRKMLLGDMNPIPSHLSGHCRTFIRRLLVPDPDIRPSISQVARMAWISLLGKNSKMTYGKPQENYLSPDIDTDVVREMTSKLDFEFSNVLNCVRKNRPGEALATYYLLLKNKSQLPDPNVERRHNDVIGSDGNLDHENESDKSSEEEGLNDIDDVTDDVIFNGTFKKEDLYKEAPKTQNGVVQNGRIDSPYSNRRIVDQLIEKHLPKEAVNDPEESLKNHERNSPRTPVLPRHHHTPTSTVRKPMTQKSNADIDRTLERLEKVQKRFEDHFKPREEDKPKTPTEDTKPIPEIATKEHSSQKFPEVASESGNSKCQKPERKSRGPTSMRELMKTMSRAKDALQRRSIFGQAKSNRTDDRKTTGSPELNKFRRLLSKNSNDSGSVNDRKSSPTKACDLSQNEDKLWRNYVPNGSHPIRVKLPEASPPATPLTFNGRTISPTQRHSPLPSHYPSKNARGGRAMLFHAGRPSLPQRSPSLNNRLSSDGSVTPDLSDRRLPLISPDKNDEILRNPLGYDNLTPRYRFPSPPRTANTRETTTSNGNSGVKEMVEKFQALMNSSEQQRRTSVQNPNTQRSSPEQRTQDTPSTTTSYLPSQRRKREDSLPKKLVTDPNGNQAQRLTSNGTNYTGQQRHPVKNHYVIKQNDGSFKAHFSGDQQGQKNYERQGSPGENTRYKSPSRGVWYKSAV